MHTQEESKRLALTVIDELKSREIEVSEVTCQECGINDTRDLAWDLYNTNGDCLAEK